MFLCLRLLFIQWAGAYLLPLLAELGAAVEAEEADERWEWTFPV